MTQKDNREHGDDVLERLGELQRLGQALFDREAGRLARKHGVDDPRAQRMIRAAGGAREMLAALEIARDAVPQHVSAAQGEIVLYGRVAHDDLKGLAGAEVTIEDTNGRVMRAAGSATTDARGHFTLRIPPGIAEKLAGKDYIITARNPQGEVIYRAANTVMIELDQAIRADVQLGSRAPIRRPAPKPRPSRSAQPADEPEKSAAPARPRRPAKPVESVIYGVSGQVLSAAGEPVGGVLVRVYDKDRQFDDLLGAALTNLKGHFSIRYRLQDFSEGEATADLFFVVVDADEKELLSTADHVMFNAGRETSVTLTIPK
jgi:hypothetical protein